MMNLNKVRRGCLLEYPPVDVTMGEETYGEVLYLDVNKADFEAMRHHHFPGQRAKVVMVDFEELPDNRALVGRTVYRIDRECLSQTNLYQAKEKLTPAEYQAVFSSGGKTMANHLLNVARSTRDDAFRRLGSSQRSDDRRYRGGVNLVLQAIEEAVRTKNL